MVRKNLVSSRISFKEFALLPMVVPRLHDDPDRPPTECRSSVDDQFAADHNLAQTQKPATDVHRMHNDDAELNASTAWSRTTAVQNLCC